MAKLENILRLQNEISETLETISDNKDLAEMSQRLELAIEIEIELEINKRFKAALENNVVQFPTKEVKAKAKKESKDVMVEWENSRESVVVEIEPKKSIRIAGEDRNCREPRQFAKTFKIGDQAIYDSYNLYYFGTIVGIGPKTVTINSGCSDRMKRLNIQQFVSRNSCDFEARKKHNAEWMD